MDTVSGGTTAPDGTFIGFGATGHGSPVVLVHGAAADARQWAAVVPLLAADHTVVAMDRRGRGASGPLRGDHSLDTEYADITAVAMAVAGGGPVYVVGHSSGARFALHAALRIPRLAGLALYEPPPAEHLSARVLGTLGDLEAVGDREGILATFLIDVAGNDVEALTFIRGRPIWPIMLDNALTLPAELRAVSAYRLDRSELAGLTAPTLCLLGEQSGPELAAVADEIIDALPAARLSILPGQGHGAMFTAPELLVSALRPLFNPAAAAGP